MLCAPAMAPVEICKRCGREAPPSDDSPEGAVAQGWITDGPPELPEYPGLICPNCQTQEEIAALWPDTPPPDL